MDPTNKQIMENHFSDYIKEVEDRNLHPKLKTTFQTMKSKPDCNIIFYGPPPPHNGPIKYAKHATTCMNTYSN